MFEILVILILNNKYDDVGFVSYVRITNDSYMNQRSAMNRSTLLISTPVILSLTESIALKFNCSDSFVLSPTLYYKYWLQ